MLTIRAADLAKKPAILPYSDRCATGKKQGTVFQGTYGCPAQQNAA